MVPVKIISIIVLAFTCLQVKAVSSDTLVVIFDRQKLVQGDSIEMEVYTEPYRQNQPAQTLHLWIENVKTGLRWKYRYPFLKGRYKFSLKITDSIPNGTYAFNFLLQKKFLAVKGKLNNAAEKDKEINYFARSGKKPPIIEGTSLQPGGFFEINNLYFTDSLFFGFSPSQKSKYNRLKISLETPIDSAFIPEALATEFITVGVNEAENSANKAVKYNYVFSVVSKKNKELMQEVVLISKEKTRRKNFEEQNVSALFDSDNSITLDFYDSDELSSYTDIYSYLVNKMPGLRIETNPENGQPLLYWRNEKTDIYVDEFADTDFSPYSISVQDIEMIKIYRPGNRMALDGLGGSVAIYTKRRSTRPGNRLSNYSFYVKGYTQKNADWK
jgi:hypothetical protein